MKVGDIVELSDSPYSIHLTSDSKLEHSSNLPTGKWQVLAMNLLLPTGEGFSINDSPNDTMLSSLDAPGYVLFSHSSHCETATETASEELERLRLFAAIVATTDPDEALALIPADWPQKTSTIAWMAYHESLAQWMRKQGKCKE